MRLSASFWTCMALLLLLSTLAAQPVSGSLAQGSTGGLIRTPEEAAMLGSVSQAILAGDPYDAEAGVSPGMLAATIPPQEQAVDLKLLEAELNAVKDKRKEVRALCDYGRKLYKDDACKLEQLEIVCNRQLSQLNEQEKALRLILPDRRKATTKFFSRIWRGLGPVGRRIVRNLTQDITDMVLAKQKVTGKVIKILLRKHVRHELQSAAFEKVVQNVGSSRQPGGACDDQKAGVTAGAEEGVGEILADKYTVRIYRGNAENFSTPPLIFYANSTDYPSPSGGEISYAAETAFPYQAWMQLPDAGSWIELTSAEPVTAMGVQLFGDFADGWVRVYVDGSPIWYGDTFYENCEFDEQGNRIVSVDTCHGGFIYYVEASGMGKAVHTIRAENAGGGEMSIYFFGIGKVSP